MVKQYFGEVKNEVSVNPAPVAVMSEIPSGKVGGRKIFKRLGIAIAVIVVAIVVWQGFVWNSGKGFFSFMTNEKYQAVFLDNNQVYFGKLSDSDSNYPVLRDIYYLRVSTNLQPRDVNAAPEINLVKLGTELHGPEDEMKINKTHILFVEDLRLDSQVVKAIADFQKYQKQQSQGKQGLVK